MNKMLLYSKATTKVSNEFCQTGLTIINFLRICGTRSIKTGKNFKCQYISIHAVATGDRKQFQYLQIVFKTKLDY